MIESKCSINFFIVKACKLYQINNASMWKYASNVLRHYNKCFFVKMIRISNGICGFHHSLNTYNGRTNFCLSRIKELVFSTNYFYLWSNKQESCAASQHPKQKRSYQIISHLNYLLKESNASCILMRTSWAICVIKIPCRLVKDVLVQCAQREKWHMYC